MDAFHRLLLLVAGPPRQRECECPSSRASVRMVAVTAKPLGQSPGNTFVAAASDATAAPNGGLEGLLL